MNKNIIVAICYDFDKTLSPKDSIQEYSFFKKLNITGQEFYKKVDKFEANNNMERSSAYLYCLIDEAQKHGVNLTKEILLEDGKNAIFYNGVETWFKRINNFGKKLNITVEHYLISANLKESLDALSISHEFKKIYASSFLYNSKDEPIWPAQAVNYTFKTQFLYRIKKGILNETDSSVNNKNRKKRVPFNNMIYIGDSFTDIPCMTIVNKNGGYSIGVYDDKNKVEKVKKLIKDKRIQNYAFADYSENSKLEKLVQNFLINIKDNSINK